MMLDVLILGLALVLTLMMVGLTGWSSHIVDQGDEFK
jgi:hypothetical protein